MGLPVSWEGSRVVTPLYEPLEPAVEMERM